MAEIKMSCIFIEKQKNEPKAMQEILLEVIDDGWCFFHRLLQLLSLPVPKLSHDFGES